MKLHYAEVLNPRKVCALAKHLDAPVTYIRIDLAKAGHRTAAFRTLNPNARVPVLEDGDKVLWESDAILCHLAMRTDSDLWPRSAERQVDVIRWLSWNQVHFQRFGGTFYFENVIKPMFGLGAPDESKIAATIEPFRTFAKILDDHLAGRDYLLGDKLSVADFAVGSVMPYLKDAKLPLDDCPAVLRWNDRLNSLDGWREPFPPVAKAA